MWRRCFACQSRHKMRRNLMLAGRLTRGKPSVLGLRGNAQNRSGSKLCSGKIEQGEAEEWRDLSGCTKSTGDFSQRPARIGRSTFRDKAPFRGRSTITGPSRCLPIRSQTAALTGVQLPEHTRSIDTDSRIGMPLGDRLKQACESLTRRRIEIGSQLREGLDRVGNHQHLLKR